jgi:small subunit ribosomal protein S8
MDQIANMIQMIKNANAREHEVVVLPFSKIKMAIAECLLRHNFIASVSKKMKKNFPVIEIGLIYTANGPKVQDVKRVSKSSRRMYTGVKGIRRVKHGQGIMVLTTPKGILTDSEARKELVGGEVLFTMW